MTRDEFMQEYMALDAKVIDLRVSDADALAAIAAFAQRTDIPDDWRESAVAAVEGSLEIRNPEHLADHRQG